MIPRVVIVGRPNVGKSSLLNVLAGRRISIVDPTAGVTRDRISALAELPPTRAGAEPDAIELIDTGGYGIADTQNLTAEVERQIARGIEQANVVLFVIDAQAGVTALDEQVAALLRRSALPNVPVVLVANKVDSEHLEAHAYEASRLGLGEPLAISAVTKHNLHDLHERLRDEIDFEAFAAAREAGEAGDGGTLEPGVLLAVVGKRNAGKSTLVNALAGDERVIVSEQEGTTRDSVDVRFELQGHAFTAIDTAGVRRRKSIADDIEYYSLHRALRSVRRADVCLFMLDATVAVSQVDRQLAREILKHYRPTVLVVNKWDLAEKGATQEQYVEYLDEQLKGLNFAPIAFIAAKAGEGVRELLGMALNLYEQARHRIETSDLNEVLGAVMAERGPGSDRGGKRAKVFYAAQVDLDPPTLVLHVNDPKLFEGNYERFLMNRLRDELPYAEVPIKLVFRGRREREQ